MYTQLHWIAEMPIGGLALAARPRGGDWLRDEMLQWQRNGIETVVSLLEPVEAAELDLTQERNEAEGIGMSFYSIPVADRQVPPEASRFLNRLREVHGELRRGRRVAVHCRQGVGRAGLCAVGLLMLNGLEPRVAIERVSRARGLAVPETDEQKAWLLRLRL